MFIRLVVFILVALLAMPVVVQGEGRLGGPWGSKKLSPEESTAMESAVKKVSDAAERYGAQSSQAKQAAKNLRDLMSGISGQPKPDEQKLRQMIQDEIKKLKGEMLTTYSPDGQPIHQAQDAKGWHHQWGSATLSGGRAIVNLNSSPAEGKQDISFMADSTYRGVAWSLDTTNTKTYWITPLSGTQVLVRSSDGADTATVRFLLEGN